MKMAEGKQQQNFDNDTKPTNQQRGFFKSSEKFGSTERIFMSFLSFVVIVIVVAVGQMLENKHTLTCTFSLDIFDHDPGFSQTPPHSSCIRVYHFFLSVSVCVGLLSSTRSSEQFSKCCREKPIMLFKREKKSA